MAQFRVAVERTYRDVVHVSVEGADENHAMRLAREEAQQLPPSKRDICGNFETEAIEVEEEITPDVETAQRLHQPDE